MKCAICGIQLDSVEEGIDEGWIPYVWDGDREQEGPFCDSCFETLIQIDEDGEYVVKEEFTGRIKYQEGDFIEEEQEEHHTIGIVIGNKEN